MEKGRHRFSVTAEAYGLTNSGISRSLASRPPHRSRSHRVLPGPRAQLNESLDKQAIAQRLATDQHRLEGAIPALSETKGAGGAPQFVDRRSLPSVGFCPAGIARPCLASPRGKRPSGRGHRVAR